MEINFEIDVMLVIGMIIGLVFVIRIICEFITRLVELRATRRILSEPYEFTNKACRNLILYANDGYDNDKDNKDII